MRKKIAILLCMLFPIVLLALNENEMDWRYGKYGVRVVTNAPSRAEMTVATNMLAQSIIGFVYSPSNLPPAQAPSFATNAAYAVTVIGPQSNDIASAVAHVADTNLHLRTGERELIFSAYSPSNPPPSFTNAYLTVEYTNGWWVPVLVTNSAAH